MLQELLHFMPIKKTIADRKDNLTVFFFFFFKLHFESQETQPLKRLQSAAPGWIFMITCVHVLFFKSCYLLKVLCQQIHQSVAETLRWNLNSSPSEARFPFKAQHSVRCGRWGASYSAAHEKEYLNEESSFSLTVHIVHNHNYIFIKAVMNALHWGKHQDQLQTRPTLLPLKNSWKQRCLKLCHSGSAQHLL